MRKQSVLTLFIAAVVAGGLVVLGAAGATFDDKNLDLVVALAALTVAFELTDFSPFPNSRVSLSAAAIIAGAATAGLAGVAIVGSAAVIGQFAAHRKPLMKVAFNEGALLVSGAAAYGVFEAFGGDFAPAIWPDALVPALVAGGVFFAVNSALVTCAISIDKGLNPAATWAEAFGWLTPHYILLGVLAVLFATAHEAWGIAGVVAPLVPLAMAWLIFRQQSGRTSHTQPGAPA